MLFCCLDDLETADFITEEEKKLSGTTVIILIAFVFYLAMMIVIGAVYMKRPPAQRIISLEDED